MEWTDGRKVSTDSLCARRTGVSTTVMIDRQLTPGGRVQARPPPPGWTRPKRRRRREGRDPNLTSVRIGTSRPIPQGSRAEPVSTGMEVHSEGRFCRLHWSPPYVSLSTAPGTTTDRRWGAPCRRSDLPRRDLQVHGGCRRKTVWGESRIGTGSGPRIPGDPRQVNRSGGGTPSCASGVKYLLL